MLKRHSIAGRKSDKLRSGIASTPGLEAVSFLFNTVLVSGEGIFLSLVKSILNTICGVVSDYLQRVHESVFNDSGRVAAGLLGRNLSTLPVSMGSLRMIPVSATSGRSPGCDIQLTFAPQIGAVSIYNHRMHSEAVSGSRIASYRVEYLDDGLSRSPLKNNKAGIYEKGDRNQ